MQMLDQHIQKFLPPGEIDLTSSTWARIRALWFKCNNLHTTAPIPSAQPFPPTPPSTVSTSQLSATSNWHEIVPPKLSIDDMETLKSQFGKNYPGEVLDAHSTPSVRLWSLVHQQKLNKHIKYIPIQLRLSEGQYSAMIESRSSNLFEAKFNFYRNFAGMKNQTSTSTHSVSLVIGSIGPLQFFEMPLLYVECATYRSSRLLTPKSASIHFLSSTTS